MAPRAAHVDQAIAFAASVVASALREPLPAGTVLNVNLPGQGSDEYQWTTLGRRFYEDDVSMREDPRGRPYYWVGGEAVPGHDEVDGSDCSAVARGWNSITPMHLDLTDRARIRPLAAGSRSMDFTPLWLGAMTRLFSIAAAVVIAIGLAACGCSPAPAVAPTTGMPLANGSAAPPTVPTAPTTCAGIEPKVDQLYRAEAQAAEPKRVDERTHDNVHMVMVECDKNPSAVVACVNGAATLADIQRQHAWRRSTTKAPKATGSPARASSNVRADEVSRWPGWQ